MQMEEIRQSKGPGRKRESPIDQETPGALRNFAIFILVTSHNKEIIFQLHISLTEDPQPGKT